MIQRSPRLSATMSMPRVHTFATFARPRHRRLGHALRAVLSVLAAALLTTSCGRPTAAGQVRDPASTPAAAPSSAGAARVLFIGNSLTTTHDLPGLVEALAMAAGVRIACRTVAFPGYSLEDHWNRADTRRAIAEGGWSTVVLQQGPSSLSESRVLLVEFARRFAGEAQRVGARTALYMVWPSRERLQDFEGVSLSYATAARDVDGILLPVGEAWRAAWRRDRNLDLYGPDGFHPTPMGSYLGALVIYQQLSGRSPVGLPATVRSSSAGSPPVIVPPDRAAMLQAAAAEANMRVGRR